jgi:RimJ/RimL family protein N-acetyltransferase
MFLIPNARDRGLGPDAARTLARWLLTSGPSRRLTVDPYRANERAVRAWMKAGFRPVEERESDSRHAEPWLLMTVDELRLDSLDEGITLASRPRLRCRSVHQLIPMRNSRRGPEHPPI